MSAESKPTANVWRSEVKRTYWLELEGGEPRLVSAWNPERRYRPQRMLVERVGGNVTRVEISGPVLKKDGSDGQATERPWRRSDWPAWAASIVDGLA